MCTVVTYYIPGVPAQQLEGAEGGISYHIFIKIQIDFRLMYE